MTIGFFVKTRFLLADAWKRLLRSWLWAALQLAGLALLIGLGIVWTRLSEKNVWQVFLTLLVPVLIVAGFLALQAGTIRAAWRGGETKPVRLVWGAATLLVWLVIGWMLWMWLDKFDGHISEWASYLNSRFDAGSRSHWATDEHVANWLTKAEWLLRWLVAPGLLLPLGSSAVFGVRRLPWRRVLRVWIDWRWWLVGLALVLLGKAWPGTFFDADPAGTVRAQVWHVVLKVTGAYVLGVLCWLVALVWSQTLVAGETEINAERSETLFACLRASKKWMFGWTCLITASISFDLAVDALPEKLQSSGWLIASGGILLSVVALVLQIGMIRAMTRKEAAPVRLIWAVLSLLLWLAIAIGSWLLLSGWKHEFLGGFLGWFVVPGLLMPWFVASARWGLKLQFRRVMRVMFNWRWWLGLVIAMLVGIVLPGAIKTAFSAGRSTSNAWVNTMWSDLPDLITLATWVVLVGWVVTLLADGYKPAENTESSLRLEPGESTGGNA